jgi:aminoglycoside phosphotransferase (APT) family kinase protein
VPRTAEPQVAEPHPSPTAALVDDARLSAWLQQEAGLDGPWRSRPLTGGNSNATFLLEGPAGTLVLRRPPAAALSGTAHSMAREHRVLQALAPTAARVPRPIGLCEDPDVIGAPFLVMDHVPGVSVTDTLPDAYAGDGKAAGRLGEDMIDALAEIHSVDWQAAGLADFGKPERFLERQVSRWTRQFESYQTRDLPRFAEVGTWLEAHRPPETPPTVIHGDFHLDNCLASPDAPRLLAVIDWEISTIGDPLLDLGLALAFWGARPIDPPALRQVQAVSRLPGTPTRLELAERYQAATGRAVTDRLGYYLALALWKLAAIIEGAYAQYVAGKLTSDYARGLGEDVPRLLEEAASHLAPG